MHGLVVIMQLELCNNFRNTVKFVHKIVQTASFLVEAATASIHADLCILCTQFAFILTLPACLYECMVYW